MGIDRTTAVVRVAGVAGALSIGAGLVHATAAGAHDGDFAVLLAMAAVVQVVLGVATAARPGRPALVALGVVNLSLAVVWAASRTTGLPIVEGMGAPEAVGLQDLTVTLMESGAAVAAAAAVALGNPYRSAGSTAGAFSPLWALAMAPALLGMTAGHVHAPGHVHDGDHDHAIETATAGDGQVAVLAADAVFSGADTGHASAAELAAAKDLIERTRQAVSSEFPDEEALVRAGYRSIGDGFPLTRFQHFVNASYLTDGRELDASHVESVVVDTSAGGSRVASAMYILERGKTMADVPALGGELTAWHDHKNLCWDQSGTRLAGFVVKGRCVPGGTLQPTPPMLHVWLADHECGPFAGVDGHGAACGAHSH